MLSSIPFVITMVSNSTKVLIFHSGCSPLLILKFLQCFINKHNYYLNLSIVYCHSIHHLTPLNKVYSILNTHCINSILNTHCINSMLNVGCINSMLNVGCINSMLNVGCINSMLNIS